MSNDRVPCDNEIGPVNRRSILAGGSAAVLGLAMPGVALSSFALPGVASAQAAGAGRKRPRFAAGLQEFKFTLPPGKMNGNISAVAVSPINGDVFFVQFPEGSSKFNVPKDKQILNYIVRVDKNGKYITSFGSKDDAPVVNGDNQWMGTPDNLECDADGNVWISPDLRTGVDNAALCYSPDGKFLKQFGVRNNKGSGPNDKKFYHHPASVFYDKPRNLWFIADGYGTHYRVVTVDAKSGEMTRMWGAYGKDPAYFEYGAPIVRRRGAGTPGAEVGHTIEPAKTDGFGIPIHKVIVAPDGKVLVADRPNSRVQEFELTPTGVRYIRQVYIQPNTETFGSTSDVYVTPDNKWIYVSSMRDNRLYFVDRATFEVVSWANVAPEEEGMDNFAGSLSPFHRFAVRPNGDVLLARTRRDLSFKKFLGFY